MFLRLLATAFLASFTFSSSACAQSQPSPVRNAPALIAGVAKPIRGAPTDYDALIAAARPAARILLGESTHGTHEYYRERSRISDRLIREAGVQAIAIEGDWSAAYRVNLYVRGLGADRNAQQALQDFDGFPQWMWKNVEFRDFVEQLRSYNLARPVAQRVGLYGMDVYDMHDAADAVVRHLNRVDPAAAKRARAAYRCFDDPKRDPQNYAAAVSTGRRSCRTNAESVLALVGKLPAQTDPIQSEERFAAIRAATSVAASEEYFRILATGASAWNARDRRMAATIEAIVAHTAGLHGRSGPVAVWAHNSHTGDARATTMAERGELSLGQLMKQQHGERAFLVGFYTHSGTVFAATEWGANGRQFELPAANPQSYSGLFNSTGLGSFNLLLGTNPAVDAALDTPRIEREIGVVYARWAELQNHYSPTRLPRRFDAVVYVDKSRAVQPI